MTVIATNVNAMRATAASNLAQNALSTSMQRLSTGKRINSAADDSAGLAISSSMTAQIRGMAQGIRNANDGISMAQTAEGAMDEVNNMLQRMRELKVQSTNGTYSTTDSANINNEQLALANQINSVLGNTTFNNKGCSIGCRDRLHHPDRCQRRRYRHAEVDRFHRWLGRQCGHEGRDGWCRWHRADRFLGRRCDARPV